MTRWVGDDATLHLVGVAVPVTVAGMTVQPGDLLHADRHGAVVVPHAAAGKLVDAAESYCRDHGCDRVDLDVLSTREELPPFYESLGYIYAGGIPDYALDPDGRPMKNAIYYKVLAP